MRNRLAGRPCKPPGSRPTPRACVPTSLTPRPPPSACWPAPTRPSPRNWVPIPWTPSPCCCGETNHPYPATSASGGLTCLLCWPPTPTCRPGPGWLTLPGSTGPAMSANAPPTSTWMRTACSAWATPTRSTCICSSALACRWWPPVGRSAACGRHTSCPQRNRNRPRPRHWRLASPRPWWSGANPGRCRCARCRQHTIAG